MNKKFDIWMPESFGFTYTLQAATAVMNIINAEFRDSVLINGLHRVGCSYRVQIECDEKTAERVDITIKNLFNGVDGVEESRGFSAS